MGDVRRAVTIEDLRDMARKRLPAFVFQPMETGSGAGESVARNVARFRELMLVPRILTGTGNPLLETELFGRRYSAPFGISAVGYAGNFRRGADRLLAEAAQQANVPFVLSGGSNDSIDQVARIAPAHVWSQLYAARDSKLTDAMIGRARDAGVDVLVYTVDVPVRPSNEWMARAGIALPSHVRWHAVPYVILQALLHPGWTFEFLLNGGPPKLESWAAYAPPGASAGQIHKVYQSQVPCHHVWREAERVRKLWQGKLVLKGVLDPEDAARAIEIGADAITVSNHGGNRLPCLPAAIDCLAQVKEVVGTRIPVLFDGGVRRGLDVLLALCLGATFCFVGRATLYGVAAGGRAGAARAISILRDEIAQVLAMGGLPSLSELGPQFIHRQIFPLTTGGPQ